jgi:type II secretory pathway pseudopilin PulG
MIRRRLGRPRSGVTLTEILISILILGVGLVSLATLFPLGLLRIREAQRLVRSTYLAESAIDELRTRNLLVKPSFTNPFRTAYFVKGANFPYYDPWIQDTPAYGSSAFDNVGNSIGASALIAPGLPVAYDPLWWNVVAQTGVYYDNNNTANTFEGRFANGMAFLRANPTDNGGPGANGLQRINNLPGSPFGSLAIANVNGTQQILNYQVALETFVSPEDIVFQDPKGRYTDPNGSGIAVMNPSPIVPDLSQIQNNAAMTLATNATVYPPQNDWRFSWMLTGQQRDTINGSIFDVNIVIHENRLFGVDQLSTGAGAVPQPSGETVVEAIWGYGSSVLPYQGLPTNIGYAQAAKRTVLLLWPNSQPDPDVRVGQWIADVTYERVQQTALTRYPGGSVSPAQRCFWYQVAKRTEPAPVNPTIASIVKSANYRQMTVWTTIDLNAQSMLYIGPPASPVNVEAALIAPSVVNVIPRQVYTR